MQHKLYSYALVTLQFILIGALLFLSQSIFSNFLALFIDWGITALWYITLFERFSDTYLYRWGRDGDVCTFL